MASPNEWMNERMNRCGGAGLTLNRSHCGKNGKEIEKSCSGDERGTCDNGDVALESSYIF